MEQELSIEVKDKMTDNDFIELGFRMQERFFRPGLLKKFVQGDFIFRFSDLVYILKVVNDRVRLVAGKDALQTLGSGKTILDLRVHNIRDWVAIAQKKASPLWLLFRGNLTIHHGGLIAFVLYAFCFTRPWCRTNHRLCNKKSRVKKKDRIEKVVVLRASPRKHGATRVYSRPLIDGMLSSGADVNLIDVYDKNIKSCRGCFHCWFNTPGVCVLKDDMAQILRDLQSSDLWVLIFPTYCGNIPSALQRTLERCFPIVHFHGIKFEDGLFRHPRRKQFHTQYMVGLNVYGFYESSQSSQLHDLLRDVAHHASLRYLGLARISNCIAKALNRQEEPTLEKDLSHLYEIGRRLILDNRLDTGLCRKLGKASPFSLKATLHTNNVFLELLEEQCREKKRAPNLAEQQERSDHEDEYARID